MDLIQIDRQFVLRAINLGLSTYHTADVEQELEGMAMAVEELPSVQPQPVVRCKDCKHADDDGVCQNSVGLVIQDDDDFCSRAERRTDG